MHECRWEAATPHPRHGRYFFFFFLVAFFLAIWLSPPFVCSCHLISGPLSRAARRPAYFRLAFFAAFFFTPFFFAAFFAMVGFTPFP